MLLVQHRSNQHEHQWRREYQAEQEHSRAEQEHSEEQEHILGQRRETLVARLGEELQDLCGGSLDDHASLSWRARETGTSLLRWRLMSQTELEKRVVARPRYSPRAVDQWGVFLWWC